MTSKARRRLRPGSETRGSTAGDPRRAADPHRCSCDGLPWWGCEGFRCRSANGRYRSRSGGGTVSRPRQAPLEGLLRRSWRPVVFGRASGCSPGAFGEVHPWAARFLPSP